MQIQCHSTWDISIYLQTSVSESQFPTNAEGQTYEDEQENQGTSLPKCQRMKEEGWKMTHYIVLKEDIQ